MKFWRFVPTLRMVEADTNNNYAHCTWRLLDDDHWLMGCCDEMAEYIGPKPEWSYKRCPRCELLIYWNDGVIPMPFVEDEE